MNGPLRPRNESFGYNPPRFLVSRKFERFERNLMIGLQSSDIHVLHMCMKIVGQCCSGEVLVLYFSLLYWVVDQNACVDAIWLVPLTEILCGLLKWHFKEPRPGWVDHAIIIRANSHEYSFPSSHAAIAVGLATYFTQGVVLETGEPYGHGLQYPKCLAFAVCLSRVYEGAHHIHDVIAGTFVGIAIALGLIYCQQEMKPFLQDKTDVEAMAYGFAACTLLLVVVVNRYRSVSKNDLPPEWNRSAKRSKSFKGTLNPHAVPFMSYVGMMGVLFGLSFGEAIRYSSPLAPPVDEAHAIARASVGLVCLLGMFFGVRAIEKSFTPGSTLALVLRAIRYGQVPPLILVLSPKAFAMVGV